MVAGLFSFSEWERLFRPYWFIALKTSRAAATVISMSSAVCAALTAKPLAQAGLAPYAASRLRADVESALNGLRNSAYAAGYAAGKGEMVAFGQRRFA